METSQKVKCKECGWIHFVIPDSTAIWECWKCGIEGSEFFESCNTENIPIGITIHPVNWEQK